MTTQDSPLSPPRMIFDSENPFNGDLFERHALAKLLTEYINRLRDGTVLAVDAPWGEGKSWFGQNWAASLKAEGYRVVYLDAFQQDYVEDPFLLIASEINQLIADDVKTAEDLKVKAAKVMKAILPVGTKILLNIASRLALGSEDGPKAIADALQLASDSAADTAEKWIEDKIEDHSNEKESLLSFRRALQDFCASQEKPVVFFIDELDRCRPTFSVQLIERLKHFFDVKNLVFVLLLNRSQLEKAIKGVYGQETDSSGYLGKFVHMYLKLPKKNKPEDGQSNANWSYLHSLVSHYKFQMSDRLNYFINALSIFASFMNLSLRDLEKGMALLALNGISDSTAYLAWPVALKLKHSEIYNGLLNDDIEAHKGAIELLDKMTTPEHLNFWTKKYFLSFHISQAYGSAKLTKDQADDLERYKPPYGYQGNPLRFWLRRLDIATQE